MRYCVHLHIIRRTDKGQLSSNYMTHIITLSNPEAVERVEGIIKEGIIGWDSVLMIEDVLEYNKRLDHWFIIPKA